MITCDLCGEAKDCLQKQIEGKEFGYLLRMLEAFGTETLGARAE